MIRPLDARPIVETFHKSLFSQKLPEERAATDAIEINIHILCLQGERRGPKNQSKRDKISRLITALKDRGHKYVVADVICQCSSEAET